MAKKFRLVTFTVTAKVYEADEKIAIKKAVREIATSNIKGLLKDAPVECSETMTENTDNKHSEDSHSIPTPKEKQ